MVNIVRRMTNAFLYEYHYDNVVDAWEAFYYYANCGDDIYLEIEIDGKIMDRKSW